MVLLKRELCNQVLVDIKEFDNIQILEHWFSGISMYHPSNDRDNSLLLNNQLF